MTVKGEKDKQPDFENGVLPVQKPCFMRVGFRKSVYFGQQWFKVISLVLFFLLLNASAWSGTMPGSIDKNISKFDGSVSYQMEPAWVRDSLFKFGLYWDSKLPNDEIIMDVVIKGTDTISNDESLLFKIDGELISLTSIDATTDHNINPGSAAPGFYFPPSTWSSKRYVINKDFLRRILEAKEVLVRVRLSKSYIEGVFSKDGFTTARPSFKKFYEKISSE